MHHENNIISQLIGSLFYVFYKTFKKKFFSNIHLLWVFFTITAKPQIFNGSVWLKNYSNVFFQIQVIATFIKKFRNTKLNMHGLSLLFFLKIMKYKKMKHLYIVEKENGKKFAIK